MSTLNIQSISIFHQVDSFVKQLIKIFSNNHSPKLDWVIAQLNCLYHPFYTAYDDDYCYSPTVLVFLGSTQALVGDIASANVVWNYELASQFLKYLKSYKTMIQQSQLSEYYQEIANQRELAIYASQLVTKYARSLVVMVALSYKQNYRAMVTLESFYEHIEKLRDLISNKQTCFSHLIGYAWALEQGVDKGVHCHLWLVYDGSKRQSDFHIGKEVGEKWLQITGNLGEYHNSNQPETKDFYKSIGKLGIGRIHRNNSLELNNAVATALYLTKPSKTNQYMLVKPFAMRTFGKGILK